MAQAVHQLYKACYSQGTQVSQYDHKLSGTKNPVHENGIEEAFPGPEALKKYLSNAVGTPTYFELIT